MVTMQDVARRSNVSLTTVSHVVNNKGNISEEVRDKVLQVISELNYKPNKTAQSLARNSTRCIGFYTSDLESFRKTIIVNEFMAGILSVTTERSYNLIIYHEHQDEAGKSYISLDHGEPIDGAIIMNPRLDFGYLQQIIAKKIPFVIIGRPNEHEALINYVDSDNVAIGYNAAIHLISRGHCNILFLNGPEDHTISMDRLEGYKLALAGENIPFSEDLVVHAGFNVHSGADAIRKAQRDKLEFTAIIAGSDALANGALSVLNEQGLNVPKDVSMICLGETLLTTNYNPPITGIDINAYELGVKAATQLIDILNKKLIKPSYSLIPFQLNERDTVIFIAKAIREQRK